jgi:glycosyltransferase involved in cell wall biosynthesis
MKHRLQVTSDTNKIISFSVIIPTRNSRNYLEGHVNALNQWIDLASEVIVIDSESTDGTVEYLKGHLKHPSIKFLDHPVGLYESWNFAIAQVTSDFTYIATIGDRITKKTAIRLRKEAQSTAVDVIISPPTLLSEHGHRTEANWPINQYLSHSNHRRETLKHRRQFMWSRQ